uniref:Chymotrypsin-like serine protease 3 n=1 Tax=Antheraea yamamai TaxID=7121 RepID=A0A1B1LTR7_ANTYA|nr:chymotrypsin-like serine protease 3 [Antheraea yamamai]
MKLTVLTLLVLISLAYARYLDLEDFLEDNTAYNYLEKIGLPLAEEIRAAEEKYGQSRIVGGSASELGQFPYQAGLLATFSQGRGVCGASLINNIRALTAAHCWNDGRNQATELEVVLGSILLFSGGERIRTSQVVMHGSWLPTLIRNDVAIIYFPSPVSFSSTISPIALPSGSQLNDNFAGSNAIASGFGLTRDGGSITTGQYLSHVEVNVITNLVCTLSFPLIVQSSNICISGANGRSTCNGDSGGATCCHQRHTPILIGVTSFGLLVVPGQFTSCFRESTSFMTLS